MDIFNEQNFSRLSFYSAVVLVAILTISTGSLFIAKKINTLQEDLVALEREFISDQQAQVKTDVLSLEAQITARHVGIDQLLEQRLKERVDEAQLTAINIYTAMNKKLAAKDVAEVIREAIRPIRFNDKQGYCFIFNLQGEVILYPANVSLEGTNFFTNNIDGGPEVITDLLKIATTTEQGYYRYRWEKPGDESGIRASKLSYVTLFKPLGWVIGTGEYIDNLDELAEKTILRELRNSLSGEITDYFFFYKLHNIAGGKDFATMLINNNRPDLVGQKLSDDYTDAKGNQFRKEFLQGLREKGEAFVIYWYKKPDGPGVGRKLSYFKLYPEWNWVISKGIYFDRLDALIAEKKEELNVKLKDDIITLGLIFLVGVAFSLIAAFFLSRGLQKIFDTYRGVQEEHQQKLKILNSSLEKQSNTDMLTQIHNRSFFNQCLILQIASANRYKSSLSLIIFDIDRFKAVNDTLGHLAGDNVLRELAGLIAGEIRQTDIFARWGGEEFTLLVPNIDLAKAGCFLEKLRKLIENHQFSIGHSITCSFGCTMYVPGESSESFLDRADAALYQAKNKGRNTWVTR